MPNKTSNVHGYIFPLLLICSGYTGAETLSSCQSSLAITSRTDMSDVCYTRHGKEDDDFLQWRGYWNTPANKELVAVTSWSEALTIMASQSGWRLPTIKELAALTSKSLIDSSTEIPESFSNYWMLQSWLTRENPAVSLIPLSSAYLLSSSYQGNSAEVMVIDIATGLISLLPPADFNSKSVYLLMVKEEAPAWVKIINQSADPDFTGECLVNENSLDTNLLIATCTGDDLLEYWNFEENTGFIRSYNGLCVKASGITNLDKIQLGSCEGDSARWNKVADANDASRYYLQYKTSAKSCMYAADHNGGGGSIKTRDVAIWNFTADGCDDGSDNHVTWKFTP